MKKIILFLAPLLLVTASFAAMPDFRIPKGVDNVKDVGGNFSGLENTILVTSTDAALATDRDSNTITDGYLHCIMAGVSTKTALSGTIVFAQFRATGTANLTSAKLLSHVFAVHLTSGTNGVPDQVTRFKPPIPFSNGLSFNLGPAARQVDPSLQFTIGVSWKKK